MTHKKQKIYYQDCKENASEAIVILTKLSAFNAAVKPSNNAKTKTGEGENNINVSAAIPDNNIANNNINNGNNIVVSSNICCVGCNYVPDTYENGLYKRDIHSLLIGLILSSLLEAGGYLTIDEYLTFIYTSYMVIFVMVCFLILTMGYVCTNNHKCVGYGFAGCGFVYLMSHLIMAFVLKDTSYYCTGGSSIGYSPFTGCIQRGFLIAKGVYVFSICYLLFMQLIGNISWINNRVKLTRYLFCTLIIYCIFVGSIVFNSWFFQIVGGCPTFVLALTCIIGTYITYISISNTIYMFVKHLNTGLFTVNSSTNDGGCNCNVGLGVVMWIFFSYYFVAVFIGMLILALVAFGFGAGSGFHETNFQAFYEIGKLCLAFSNIWVLTKAIHPCLANCGDKNIKKKENININVNVNKQEIELQVSPVAIQNANNINNNGEVFQEIPSDDISNKQTITLDSCAICCPECAKSCIGKPLSYELGLPSNNLNLLVLSLFIFILFTISPELTLKIYQQMQYCGYINFGSLILQLFGCILYYLKKYQISSYLFLVGGIFYAIGCILYAFGAQSIQLPCPEHITNGSCSNLDYYDLISPCLNNN